MKKLNKHKLTILKVLRSVKTHPSADWVFQEVKKEIPNISLGTVYRNLSYLKTNNMILALTYSGVMNRFDGNPKNHPHILCTECGKVNDIDINENKLLLKNAEKISGYKVHEYRLEFSGICRDCKFTM